MANLQFQLEGNAAQLYEKYSVPMGAKPAAERLLDNIRLTSSDSVLDAACGTGIVTRLIAARSQPVASIVGVDLNDNMPDVARSLEPSTGFPIEWRQGDLCALSFSDAEFDVVLCSHGFQFFPDKAVALNEIKRVLVPGGRFAFTVWSAQVPYLVAMANSIRRYISDDVAKSCLAPFSYRDGATIQKALDDAGFRCIDMQEVGFTRRLPATESAVLELVARSAFARDVNAAGEDVRQAIAREVCEAMQPYREGDEFAEPLRNHLVRVNKPLTNLPI